MPFLSVYINFKEKLFKKVKSVFNPLCVKVYLGILLLFNFLIWLSVYYIANQVIQKLVVLHYNVDFGANLVGNVGNMYTIPIVGLVIIAVNFFLLFFFAKNNDLRVVAHFLLATAVAANFFLLISLVPIYFINFS